MFSVRLELNIYMLFRSYFYFNDSRIFERLLCIYKMECKRGFLFFAAITITVFVSAPFCNLVLQFFCT